VVYAVKPPGGDAAAGRARAQPQLDQLPAGDHPVLSQRTFRDRSIEGVLRITST